MQSYEEISNWGKICSISGYAWLIFLVNQEEIGTRLGLTRSYVKHIPMFKDYLDLLKHKHKKAYIYQVLADKYEMHHDSVKRVISRMLRTITL